MAQPSHVEQMLCVQEKASPTIADADGCCVCVRMCVCLKKGWRVGAPSHMHNYRHIYLWNKALWDLKKCFNEYIIQNLKITLGCK